MGSPTAGTSLFLIMKKSHLWLLRYFKNISSTLKAMMNPRKECEKFIEYARDDEILVIFTETLWGTCGVKIVAYIE